MLIFDRLLALSLDCMCPTLLVFGLRMVQIECDEIECLRGQAMFRCQCLVENVVA